MYSVVSFTFRKRDFPHSRASVEQTKHRPRLNILETAINTHSGDRVGFIRWSMTAPIIKPNSLKYA